MLKALLRPLTRIAVSPTLAAGAASWGIGALQGHVDTLTQVRDELEARVAELAEQERELEDAIGERQAQLADLDAELAAAAPTDPAVGYAEPAERVCHNPTPHDGHRWHDGSGMAAPMLRDCPGLPPS